LVRRAVIIIIRIFGARRIARTLIRRAVVIAGNHLTVVAGLMIVAAIVTGLMVVAVISAGFLAVMAAAFAGAAIVAAAGTTVARFAVAAIVVIAVAAFAAMTAAFAATVMVPALAAIGESLGHGELDAMVDAERQRRREADRQGCHGGGLQQPAQAHLPKIGLIGGKLLA
jgi:hypothetical protein